MSDRKMPECIEDAELDVVTGGMTRAATQNDLDNGRLIAEIGVAPTKPAEFVVFRIGQKTATAGE